MYVCTLDYMCVYVYVTMYVCTLDYMCVMCARLCMYVCTLDYMCVVYVTMYVCTVVSRRGIPEEDEDGSGRRDWVEKKGQGGEMRVTKLQYTLG